MDVVTFGETMVLFTPESVGPLRYVSRFAKTIGGAESNVAIALVRLGHRAGWISRLGNDEFGRFVRNFIRGEGVDTSRVLFDDSAPTAVYFKERQAGQESKVYYYRSGSAASRMTPDDLDEAYIAQARFLHFTGITPALSPSCRETVHRAIEVARRHGITVVFDPNIRLRLWSREEARDVLRQLSGLCDIVLPGLEEGEIITGESVPEVMAQRFLEYGAKAVVLKLGERGAYYIAGGEQGYVNAVPVRQVIDPVGAGDGFAAGLLSGLIRGWPWREAVALGNRVGAYALTVAGDVEGYPFWTQVAPDGDSTEILR